MSHPFNGNVEKVTLEDECGPINIYMLPFIKPAVVRPFFQEDDVSSYDRAMAVSYTHLKGAGGIHRYYWEWHYGYCKIVVCTII